jgi:hypothetical protein
LKQDIPFDIPAGSKVDLECELAPGRPGSFTNQMHIYVDDFGLRELIVTVKGTAK